MLRERHLVRRARARPPGETGARQDLIETHNLHPRLEEGFGERVVSNDLLLLVTEQVLCPEGRVEDPSHTPGGHLAPGIEGPVDVAVVQRFECGIAHRFEDERRVDLVNLDRERRGEDGRENGIEGFEGVRFRRVEMGRATRKVGIFREVCEVLRDEVRPLVRFETRRAGCPCRASFARGTNRGGSLYFSDLRGDRSLRRF